jgi:hypothetical protein
MCAGVLDGVNLLGLQDSSTVITLTEELNIPERCHADQEWMP